MEATGCITARNGRRPASSMTARRQEWVAHPAAKGYTGPLWRIVTRM
jgi:hypothetical protein